MGRYPGLGFSCNLGDHLLVHQTPGLYGAFGGRGGLGLATGRGSCGDQVSGKKQRAEVDLRIWVRADVLVERRADLGGVRVWDLEAILISFQWSKATSEGGIPKEIGLTVDSRVLNEKSLPKGKAFRKIRMCRPYFTLSTTALNASGWFIAKSAKTLRLSSISAFLSKPIN